MILLLGCLPCEMLLCVHVIISKVPFQLILLSEIIILNEILPGATLLFDFFPLVFHANQILGRGYPCFEFSTLFMVKKVVKLYEVCCRVVRHMAFIFHLDNTHIKMTCLTM